MQEAGIPAYDFPEDAAQALSAMAKFRAWLQREPGEVPDLGIDAAALQATVADAPAGWLDADRAYGLLEAAGIRVAGRALADTPAEAAAQAVVLGTWPAVLKWDAPDQVHKSDVGGVRLGLEGGPAVEAAAAAMSSAFEGSGRFLIQEQIAGGRELILGARRDPATGPVVMVGLGGVHAEVLGDVALRVLPLTDREATSMVDDLRGAPLLAGHRGETVVDRPAVEDALLRLAQLIDACPRIAELDVNPLIARPEGQGAVAVDVRVRLE